METEKYQNATDEEKAKMMKQLVKTPSKQEMKHGDKELSEEEYKDATISNMFNKIGVDPKHYKDLHYMGGTQDDKINAIMNLDLSGPQRVIMFKTLYPNSNEVTDVQLADAFMETGMSREEIMNYGKLAGLVVDGQPLQLDTDVIDRDEYNEMLYGLKAVDERAMMTDSLARLLPEAAPQIIQEAKSLERNEEALLQYLSNLEIDGIQKMLIYKKIKPKRDPQIDQAIVEHIINLDISEEEKIRILNELKIR